MVSLIDTDHVAYYLDIEVGSQSQFNPLCAPAVCTEKGVEIFKGIAKSRIENVGWIVGGGNHPSAMIHGAVRFDTAGDQAADALDMGRLGPLFQMSQSGDAVADLLFKRSFLQFDKPTDCLVKQFRIRCPRVSLVGPQKGANGWLKLDAGVEFFSLLEDMLESIEIPR